MRSISSGWLIAARALWHQTAAAAISIELVFVSAVVLAGLVVAGSTMRNALLSEFVDTIGPIQNLNQTVAYSGTQGSSSATSGSDFLDGTDHPTDGDDVAGIIVGIDPAAPIVQEGLDIAAIIQNLSYSFTMTRGGFSWSGAADFTGGAYTAIYWPGVYNVMGTTVTMTLNPLGFGWNSGVIVMDATDPANMTGSVSWTHISGFIWTAIYSLTGM